MKISLTYEHVLGTNPDMDADCLKPQDLPNLNIDTLGQPTIDSPLIQTGRHFTEDDEKITVYSHLEHLITFKNSPEKLPMFERAGPRRKIFFQPENLNCGIVTCGGLCPGLNYVIRTITLRLTWQ